MGTRARRHRLCHFTTYDGFRTVMSHTLRNLPAAVFSFLDARSRLMERRAISIYLLTISLFGAVAAAAEDQSAPADGSLAVAARAAASSASSPDRQDAVQA